MDQTNYSRVTRLNVQGFKPNVLADAIQKIQGLTMEMFKTCLCFQQDKMRKDKVMTINHPYCSSLFSEFKYNNVTPPYEIVSQDTLGMKDDTIAGFI